MESGGSSKTPCAIPFNFFCRLIEEFGRIKPVESGKRLSVSREEGNRRKHIDVLQSWIARLHRPLPPGTGCTFFHFLFPEEDEDRKYNMQEGRLARLLADVLVVDTAPGKRGHRLTLWDDSVEGCLGLEVQQLLESTYSGPEFPSTPTFQEVDGLLDELASHSRWSNVSKQGMSSRHRSSKDILVDLYRDLTPFGAAVVTQIILKDLRPLAYRQPAISLSASLLSFNSKSYEEISMHMAMRAWHPKMCLLYRTNGKLEVAAQAVEQLSSTPPSNDEGIFEPVLGVPVEIPKCVKGHSCGYALRRLSGSARLYAETKYDGERMQIHIDFSAPTNQQIRIFSKSKRDSTEDRIATHSIIRASLGLPPGSNAHEKLIERLCQIEPRECTVNSAILEAEMVAFSEVTGDIDKFWRIRGIIGETARGVRRRSGGRRRLSAATDSDTGDETKVDLPATQDSLRSDGTASESRHFMLIFFDVLHVNGLSLLGRPYEHRRLALKQLIVPIAGFSRVARALVLPVQGEGESVALSSLEDHFLKETIKYKEEGIVLKAGDSTYNDLRKPWIKLKRDYIRGYGDTLDFVVLGARWSKERGRELRVGPAVNTTFYVGCITNMSEVKLRRSARPHFEVYFTVEYGLSREQLEDLNLQIEASGLVPFKSTMLQGLPYTVHVASGLQPPKSLFNRPILMELMGDRFTKAVGSPGYELRFPRITKVWRTEERNWTEGVSLQKLRKIATESVQRSSDVIAQTVNVPTSPTEPQRHPSKRAACDLAEDQPIKRQCAASNLQELHASNPMRSDRGMTVMARPKLPSLATSGCGGTVGTSDKENKPPTSPTRFRAGQPLRARSHAAHKDVFRARIGPAKESSVRQSAVIDSVHPPSDAHSPSCTPPAPRNHAFHAAPISTLRGGLLSLLYPIPLQAHRDFPPVDFNPQCVDDLSMVFTDAAVWSDTKVTTQLPVLSTTNCFSTLDAFLVATGWCIGRVSPVQKHLNRGIIFASSSTLHAIIETLHSMQASLRARKQDKRLRIFVCLDEELQQRSERETNHLKPVWVSA